ncbi:hypothetical protein C8R44DRAFT_990755 [Mycena epipterygia]|nr:hypothetical protein C8R44DRAFT_990755 [Mycena epipterygia]
MICEWIPWKDRNYVEILGLDLVKGTHSVLMIARCPDTDGRPLYASPTSCGTVAVVNIAWDQDRHFVVDWNTQSCFMLCCPEGRVSSIALIPHYIILETNSDQEVHLALIASDDVRRLYGVPVIGVREAGTFNLVPHHELPKTLTHCIAPDPLRTSPACVPRLEHRLSVHESPLRLGTYRLWLRLYIDNSQEVPYTAIGPTSGDQPLSDWLPAYVANGDRMGPVRLGSSCHPYLADSQVLT